MFDPNRALSQWKEKLASEAKLNAEQVAELESHVLDTAENLGDRLTDEEKFWIATQRLGHPAELRHEYEKASPWTTWRVPIFWATVGVAWALGIEAILDAAIPLGALVAAQLHWPLLYLETWTFGVYVGGPLVAFASVGAWMRRYSIGDPQTTKALLVTTTLAIALRLASVPLLRNLQDVAWAGFNGRSWRSLQSVWQTSGFIGLMITAAVAALVVAKFRRVDAAMTHR